MKPITLTFVALLCALAFAACIGNADNGNQPQQAVQLAVPGGLTVNQETKTVSWDAVPNANGYKVKVGDTEYDADNGITFSLASITAAGAHPVSVKANAYDGRSTASGGNSAAITINGGVVTAVNIGGGNGGIGGRGWETGANAAGGKGGDSGTITMNGGAVWAVNYGGGTGGDGGRGGGGGGFYADFGGGIAGNGYNGGRGGTGGKGGDSGAITINGGAVEFTARIGGGDGGSGGNGGNGGNAGSGGGSGGGGGNGGNSGGGGSGGTVTIGFGVAVATFGLNSASGYEGKGGTGGSGNPPGSKGIDGTWGAIGESATVVYK